jgi:hypothetical protein
MTNLNEQLSKLKRLATEAADDSPAAWPFAAACFQKAATPDAILALIAEVEAARRAPAAAPAPVAASVHALAVQHCEEWDDDGESNNYKFNDVQLAAFVAALAAAPPAPAAAPIVQPVADRDEALELHYPLPSNPHTSVINRVLEARSAFITGWEAHARAVTAPKEKPCREDGRCQYAIDHGVEDIASCSPKCVMPARSSILAGLHVYEWGSGLEYYAKDDVDEAISAASMQVPANCPHCGTHEVSMDRTCHNSACEAYARAETTYEGWKNRAAITSSAGEVKP